MSVACHQCHASFENYGELAQHILKTKNHRKGRKWAAKHIMINSLSAKNRTDIPQKAARNPDDPVPEKVERELSGENIFVVTVCPKCNRESGETMPVEFAKGKFAWRVNGRIARLCRSCGSVRSSWSGPRA